VDFFIIGSDKTWLLLDALCHGGMRPRRKQLFLNVGWSSGNSVICSFSFPFKVAKNRGTRKAKAGKMLTLTLLQG
jgi:hypothetical protein